MVRLGDIIPQILQEDASGNPMNSGKESTYDWEAYTESERSRREASVPNSNSADVDINYSSLLLLVQETIVNYLSNMNYDIIVGEPLVSVSVALVVFMILNRLLSFAATVLIFALLININPIYLTIGYIMYRFYILRFSSPKYRAVTLNFKKESSQSKKSTIEKLSTDKFDHILIGNSLSVYLTAAFLSRIGRRCCLLEPIDLLPQQEIPGSGSLLPSVSLHPLTLFQPNRVNRILRSLSLPSFLSPIGTPQDGFCHTILSFLFDGSLSHLPIRAGLKSLSQDLSAQFHCPPALIAAFEQLQEWCLTTTSTIIYYAHSTVSSNVNWTSQLGRDGGKWLTLVTGTICSDFMSQIPEDSSVSVALRMLSYWVSEEYSMKFEKLAGINLITSLVQSADGAYTISGGSIIFKRLMKQIINSTGGAVVNNVSIEEILLNDSHQREVLGVKVGPQLKPLYCSHGLISGAGVLTTLTKFIPLSTSSPSLITARNKLKKLVERRPVIHVVYWLTGTASSLGLSSCEYLQYLKEDINHQSQDLGSGPRSVKIWSPSARDPEWSNSHPNLQTLVVKIEVGNDLVCLKTHPSLGFSFYVSTNDTPSTSPSSPPAAPYPTQLLLSPQQIDSLTSFSTAMVTQTYPLVQDTLIKKIEFVPPPPFGGHSLSSTVDKFLSQITAKTDIPGLYFCGNDISLAGTNGEIMSAVAAVCAVLNYSPAELRAGRNIITDLEQTKNK